MKKIALVLAAIAATSGAAFAGDFATTLHYPEAPRATDRAASKLDLNSTGSIVRKIVSGKQLSAQDNVAAPAANAPKK